MEGFGRAMDKKTRNSARMWHLFSLI